MAGRLTNGNGNGSHPNGNGAPGRGADLELLFIDDRWIHRFASRTLSGFKITRAENWLEAKSLLEKGTAAPRIAFLEPCSDSDSSLADQIEGLGVAESFPIVVFSVRREPEAIVEATRQGVIEYLPKPATAEQLQELVERLLNEDVAERQRPARKPVNGNGHHNGNGFLLVGEPLRRIQDLADQIANSRVPVLVEGESGVGKEVVARLLHRRSKLAEAPFVKVNCAALPVDLIESELFGHTRGAFTGAHEERAGKFLVAHKGTLFLDEIGEFPTATQAKLLQVLQDGHFTPLGKDEEIAVEVRVIAATNRDLRRAVEKGEFREDLFYRLNVIRVQVPPLRERPDEIETFARYFVEKFCKELSITPPQLPDTLVGAFLDYQWPGNVRELENLVRRFILLQNPSQIEDELRARQPREAERQGPVVEGGYGTSLKAVGKQAAAHAEQNLIVRTLRETSGNKWQAAKKLGVSYKTLLTRIESYGIKYGGKIEAVG